MLYRGIHLLRHFHALRKALVISLDLGHYDVLPAAAAAEPVLARLIGILVDKIRWMTRMRHGERTVIP